MKKYTQINLIEKLQQTATSTDEYYITARKDDLFHYIPLSEDLYNIVKQIYDENAELKNN